MDKFDEQTPEWRHIEDAAKDRLASLESELRKFLPEQETNFIRGQINVLLWLLETPERVRAMRVDPDDNIEVRTQA